MDVEVFKPLVDEGLSQREMAQRLGCSQTTISYWMRKHRLTTLARSGPKAGYSDDAVRELVAQATSWEDLRRLLARQCDSKPERRGLEAAVERLRLDTSHFIIGHPSHPPLLQAPQLVEAGAGAVAAESASKAREYYAAAWYSLAGATVSLPSEARYDLIADFGGHMTRVQVKGASVRRGNGWEARLTSLGYSSQAEMSAAGRRAVRPYLDGEIDEFFVVCADGSCYRFPRSAVDGWRSAVFPGRLASFEVNRPWG